MDRVPRIKNKSNISDTNTRIPELKAVLKAKGRYHKQINFYILYQHLPNYFRHRTRRIKVSQFMNKQLNFKLLTWYLMEFCFNVKKY